ncbi:uncharacterized protein [Chelonus insularis]|uniref:uncharacterized protein n=1 Tax=Chelonus insularis TaxID=460826 RepID=UPI0015891257|nr:uncharacterized protein LOC118064790 [Chelonus insularis]
MMDYKSEELKKLSGRAERRPSDYDIQGPRALVKSSFHLMHSKIPEVFQGRSHLIVALSALVYSRLIRANNWSTPILDLIFNHAHIYLLDLARAIGKKVDENFQLTLDDILGDIYLGIYAAKIHIEANIIPGAAKKAKGKGKYSIDSGLVDFFQQHQSGIFEIKNTFYALWKDEDKYYFFDPFACDEAGFRVNLDDCETPEDIKRYEEAVACVTMNNSIEEMVEIILDNTGSTEKDQFFIHGVRILYIKVASDDLENEIVYREKKVNRRPLPPTLSPEKIIDQCKIEVDIIPRPRSNAERIKNSESQFPELMKEVNNFMMKEKARKEDGESLELRKNFNEEEENHQMEKIQFFQIIHPHCLILQSSKNCLSEEYDKSSRGRQGISVAISAIFFAQSKHPSLWSNFDLNSILDLGNQLHSSIIDWIKRGSPKIKEDLEDEDDEKTEDDDDEDEETEEEESETTEEEDDDNDKIQINKVPKFIDISMLPEKMKIGNNWVNFQYKKSIMQGDADPLVNLGEALERYFNDYNELILENKQLMYGIWKKEGYYFLFQPYGSDNEGWRVKGGSSVLLVTDSINELVNLLHGILEFNDRKFTFHFISIQSMDREKKVASIKVETPEERVEMYQTMFLPLTDEDLLALKSIEQKNREELKKIEKDHLDKLEEEEEEEEDEEDEEDEESDEEENETDEDREDEKREELLQKITEEIQEIFEDPLIEIPEQDRSNSPDELNLFLLTANVNLEEEIIDTEAKEVAEYERLKYNLPPPYVSPPKKVLALLLAAKKASQSVPSLVSCFSIDSKLAVKTDLPSSEPLNATIINTTNVREEAVKIIKLPLKKYLYSRILPTGFTPLRAINEKYIHDEGIYEKEKEEEERECRENQNSRQLRSLHRFEDFINDDSTEIKANPTIIPLGPIIKTPTPQIKPKPCQERNKKVDKLSNIGQQKKVMKTLGDNIESIMMDLIFSESKSKEQPRNSEETGEDYSHHSEASSQLEESINDNEQEELQSEEPELLRESIGFIPVEDKYGIILGSKTLDDRSDIQECKLRACFFAAILCLLTKIQINVKFFRTSLIDDIILEAKALYEDAGVLKYRVKTWTYNLELFKVKFYIVLNEEIFAEPEKYEMDIISRSLERYLKKHSSGILVFENASYAFWFTNNGYYLFDPYSCDEKGNVSENGSACLLEFYKIDDFIKKVQEYCNLNSNNPYSIYNLHITRMEWVTEKKKFKSKKKDINKNTSTSSFLSSEENTEEESIEDIEITSQQRSSSLIELSDWIKNKEKELFDFDTSLRGFVALKNFNASVLEVRVVENDITRPNLPAFMSSSPGTKKSKTLIELPRRKPFDRKFNEHSILAEPLDLCIMAWSCIHEPSRWGFRTIRGIVEACEDLAFDSLLAAEDSTVNNMIDGLLTEFDIANYRFQAVFAPLHYGTLYSKEDWNLTMSIKKLFDTPIYTGAFISCGKMHIGLMKVQARYYFWYTVAKTPNLKIVTSTDLEEFIKLIVLLIDEPEEMEFRMRIITISYARKLDPDCSDMNGLHESSSLVSLPQIHRKNDFYDIEKIFYTALPCSRPQFILGTVGFELFEEIKEPQLKRCYFAALLSVTVNRDIMQSPIPSMVDKIIQASENLYRQCSGAKYHAQHILKNIPIMNRVFDFRDIALDLVSFDDFDNLPEKKKKENMCSRILKEFKKYFIKHNSGIIHFTNCCYGFWYSPATNAYYYFNPYQNDDRGRKVKNGAGFLGIFSSLCQMVKSMISNFIEDVTGFFIHEIHVESINVISSDKLQEDPMWIYLDYHWSIDHARHNYSAHSKIKKKQGKHQDDLCKQRSNLKENKTVKKLWNYYTIEIPNMIYSLWGTLGAYDNRFGNRKGKNKEAICIAILAMQFLCHPSKWGPAILDSAVICGDCYYTESLKAAAKEHKHSNSFNLQPFFKVSPHIWKIDVGITKCGVLYGGKRRPTLAALLKYTLNEYSNILLKCGNISIAVLATGDGFYAADPCWTGPPLFSRHHGALYVLRCRNLNALIYVLVKMINTNQRLEFFITPITFHFKQERCPTAIVSQKNQNDQKRAKKDKKTQIKKILLSSHGAFLYPGIACGPNTPISGAITVPNEDSYQKYRQNVALGIKNNLENPPATSPEPDLSVDHLKNVILSTSWHKKIGRSKLHRQSSAINVLSLQKDVEKNRSLQKTPQQDFDRYSAIEFLKNCDDYPRTVDFLEDKCVEKFSKYSGKHSTMVEESISKPLDCLPPRKFISNRSKKEFKKKVKEMREGELSMKSYKPKKSVVFRHQSTVFDNLLDENFEDEAEELTMADVL